jgi:hypothetical protein
MPALDRRIARREQVVFQQVQGKQVLLNLADGQYYALDEVGSRIWALCDGSRSIAEVISVIAEEFDAPLETIRVDTLELLDDLLDAELVVEAA